MRRAGERGRCDDSGSEDGDVYDSGVAFAGISLFVFDVGRTVFWDVTFQYPASDVHYKSEKDIKTI